MTHKSQHITYDNAWRALRGLENVTKPKDTFLFAVIDQVDHLTEIARREKTEVSSGRIMARYEPELDDVEVYVLVSAD